MKKREFLIRILKDNKMFIMVADDADIVRALHSCLHLPNSSWHGSKTHRCPAVTLSILKTDK
jgi:hypothetical protein